jgi:hypothetical protein
MTHVWKKERSNAESIMTANLKIIDAEKNKTSPNANHEFNGST